MHLGINPILYAFCAPDVNATLSSHSVSIDNDEDSVVLVQLLSLTFKNMHTTPILRWGPAETGTQSHQTEMHLEKSHKVRDCSSQIPTQIAEMVGWNPVWRQAFSLQRYII